LFGFIYSVGSDGELRAVVIDVVYLRHGKREHWPKYPEKIRGPDDGGQLLHFGRYICREWNARHAGTEQPVDFQITYMKEQTLADYQLSALQKQVLWEHRC
jgi:hypothetical protein